MLHSSSTSKNSTTVRKSTRSRRALRWARTALQAAYLVSDGLGVSLAERWFTTPRRYARPAREVALLASATRFTVPVALRSPHAHGARIPVAAWRWGHGPVALLVHGWEGRGSQLASFVEPLVRSGMSVVAFDAPAHGDSDHGPAGPRRTHGVEFAQALDAVFCRFGPAEAVVAHSLGTIATYLALRFGWLGTRRLVLIAPMVESRSLLDQFQAALGFGERTRRAFERAVLDWVGIPIAEFDARFQATQLEPVPTLVIADRGDRQTPYDDVVETATARIEQQQVRRCLDGLTELQREAITLAYYGGNSYREVADLLGTALPTIKTRMRDGLIRMRDCLGVTV